MCVIHARIINPQKRFHSRDFVPFAIEFWFDGKWRITGAQDRIPKGPDLDKAKAAAEKQFARNTWGREYTETLKIISFVYE